MEDILISHYHNSYEATNHFLCVHLLDILILLLYNISPYDNENITVSGIMYLFNLGYNY